MAESDLNVRDRSLDYDSDIEIDVLDSGEPWEDLAEARESAILRKRSMERSAKNASFAKKSRVAQGKSTQVKLNPKQRVDEPTRKKFGSSAL